MEIEHKIYMSPRCFCNLCLVVYHFGLDFIKIKNFLIVICGVISEFFSLCTKLLDNFDYTLQCCSILAVVYGDYSLPKPLNLILVPKI